MAIALFSVFVGLLLYIWFRIDWVKEAEKAYAIASADKDHKPQAVDEESGIAAATSTIDTPVEGNEAESNIGAEKQVREIELKQVDSEVSLDFSRVNSRVTLLENDNKQDNE